MSEHRPAAPVREGNDYLSRFPLGFRGCYNCGENAHYSTRDCPLARSGDFNKQKFFLEMWAHRPHTTKLLLARHQSSSSNQTNTRSQNYATNSDFNHNYNINHSKSHKFHDNRPNNNFTQMNHNSSTNHNMTHNNMAKIDDTNHRHMHQDNNMNPNAIGNDGIIEQRVNQQNDTKNVSSDDVRLQNRAHDLLSYQN